VKSISRSAPHKSRGVQDCFSKTMTSFVDFNDEEHIIKVGASCHCKTWTWV